MTAQDGVSRSEATLAVLGCAGRTVALLAGRRLHLPTDHVGQRIAFADGTSARVFRETTTEAAPTDACVLVVRFRLRWVRGRGHAAFERESLLNTILFAGFPGLVSKLWLAADEQERYRGLYEWDGPDRAEHYARCLGRVLAIVSVAGSIDYHIREATTRESALNPLPATASAGTADVARWWEPVALHPGVR